jgi:REP element-mobilizing transposase RayT
MVVHACAIMPDHVHLIVGKHPFNGDELIACLKRAATRGMNAECLHPMRNYQRANGRLPSPWSAGGWSVMLFTPEQMRAAVRYVNENPVKAGLKRQRWSFVVTYEGDG